MPAPAMVAIAAVADKTKEFSQNKGILSLALAPIAVAGWRRKHNSCCVGAPGKI